MASRPLVIPDPFTGEGKWEEWLFHFENVSDVNSWDEAQKLKWLKVHLTSRAQTAFQRLPLAARTDYKEAAKKLGERFEPKSRKTRYQAELQARRKRNSESWADLADDLRNLADKAYPELQDEARERLALNQYLQQLDQPQVAFGVKSKQPEKLDDAVSATLELETYVNMKPGGSAISCVLEEADGAIAAVHAQPDKLTHDGEAHGENGEVGSTNSAGKWQGTLATAIRGEQAGDRGCAAVNRWTRASGLD